MRMNRGFWGLVGLAALAAGCSQPLPNATQQGGVPGVQGDQGYVVQQQGGQVRVRRDRPGVNRPNRPGSRRPSWWGSHAWRGRALRPAWWGTRAYVPTQFIVLNGFYYPYVVYNGLYYPEYTEPYTYVDGAFVQAYDIPEPVNMGVTAVSPQSAIVVAR